ncbi:hypothetical protein EJ05DRAFT_513546 [Pseudovirgaria hyperparasitica]|uniref:Uncharacterized protein n=1 Tax=Pseudovirgaria hyperparasitica TaxID=470096 RepID=A0A6A6W0Z2_9PEZI|nr:uncharacterized protein EJ05DRAFT_513546 [Pseudovirgaria hyperparasitica]KAF2755247.1 hypothetical protein EJ05DRAFT_513546 [Pseudovirgaria hyperparasitica]
MADHPRRPSQSAAASSIPPAPPLPPPKFAARNVFTRFVTQPFTYGSRPPSVQANRADGQRSASLAPRGTGVNPAFSKEASHKTGLEISAVDINHDGTHAVLAGREILKTISVTDTHCAEEDNLRSAIINYTGTVTGPGPAASRHRETFEIHDVKWSHGQYDSYIATAATNGKVILYDLKRTGKEVARLHEHHRQVHKLAFNPHKGHLLLSGSQDATVRLWDLRDMRRDVMSCASRDKFSGMSEGIRDLKWSPTDGVEFAFGTDNGVIQRWDFRQNRGPKLKINAHEKTVNAIDWHPDGKHLMSASTDKTVRVWDFSSEVRRQKPAFVLRTPFPVYNARWRPSCWVPESREHGSLQCTQLATSYDRDHAMVHLWDLRRPYLPFREIHRYSMAPTDMLWHGRDLLWTVGREGMFTQNDVNFAPKVIDRRNMQAFAVSATGEINAFSQKRSRSRNSEHTNFTQENYPLDSEKTRSSPDKGSLGRVSADDSLDDSFLSTSFNRHHGRTASNRSAKSFSSTPPSSDMLTKVVFLDESLAIRADAFKPNQTAFRGSLPGSLNLPVFTYLAQKYKAMALTDPPSVDSYLNLPKLFGHNAEYAEKAALFRLAETWQIVGHAVFNVVSSRAEQHRRLRVEQSHPPRQVSESRSKSNLDVVTPAKTASIAHRAVYGPSSHSSPLLTVGHAESTSNLPTPLARPVAHSTSHTGDGHLRLPDLDNEDALNLPPAIVGPHSNGDVSSVSRSHRDDLQIPRPNFNNPRWYSTTTDLDERRAMVGSYRAQRRTPLTYDQPNPHAIDIRAPPNLDRHNSDESFAMFSASSGSQREPSMSGSFASVHSQNMESKTEGPQESHDSSPNLDRYALSPISRSAHRRPRLDMRHMSPSPSSTQTEQRLAESTLSPKNTISQAQVTSSGSQALSPAQFSAERRKAIEDIDVLHRNNYLMRHDSSESEALTSDKGSPFSALSAIHETIDASGTIVPDGFQGGIMSPESADLAHPPFRHGSTTAATSSETHAVDESLQLEDFQVQSSDVDTESNSPFTVIDMIRSVLCFHTGVMADAQTSSLILLLVSPLLPPTHPLCSSDTELVKSTYAEVLTSLGMAPTQVHAIIHGHLADLLKTGIHPFEAESIISTYHTQLHSLGLFNAAASLRRLAYPVYPGVYEYALKDTQLNLLCTNCKSPLNNPRDKTRCETCRARSKPCPICGCKAALLDPASKHVKYKPRKKGVKFGDPGLANKSDQLSDSILGTPQVSRDNLADTESSSNASSSSPIVPVVFQQPAVLWTACPLCSHGGHSACMAAWWADAESEGACPTQGCICDCVKGTRRTERLRKLEEEVAEKEKGKVKGDEWLARESKAVVGVRGALGGGGGSGSAESGLGGVSGKVVVKDEGKRVNRAGGGAGVAKK